MSLGRAVLTVVAMAGVLPRLIARQAPVHSSPAVLHTVAEIALTGPAVRFDYQTLDTASNRLYIAHMDADQLVVVDPFALPNAEGIRSIVPSIVSVSIDESTG